MITVFQNYGHVFGRGIPSLQKEGWLREAQTGWSEIANHPVRSRWSRPPLLLQGGDPPPEYVIVVLKRTTT